MANDDLNSPEGFSVYNVASGAIRAQFGALSVALENMRDDEDILAGRWDDRRWYVTGGALENRPKLFASDVISVPADGVSEVVVTGIPSGALIKLNREGFQTITDGSFEFVSAIPGEWKVEILQAFPFQDQVVRIIAHAL